MKAVFLDRATFSADLDLPMPQGITDYQVYPKTPNDPNTIIERCRDADIIITNKVELTAEIIEQLPKLKLIQLTATGMNNVDKDACERQGIALKNVAGYAVKSVPEHTFMLILSAMRAVRHYHNQVVSGNWQADGRFCLLDTPLIDLEGKTLGIIGYGTIGKRVAEIAKVFGMNVLIAEHQGKLPRNSDYTAFDEVLAKSDIITLHCPLTDDTQHLINTDTLSKMAKKPLLVNVARGGVVESFAVAQAVQDGQLMGYASDVFEYEPMTDDDPLLSLAHHPRVIFTPHNAWGSVNAQLKLWDIVCEQVTDFIKAFGK
ncbi:MULTISPECIES: D-2-hydroxyacid dehydrogenase [unclassified Moraxella]|uniref:D-2-hydroxyacid dehydrogenase n=1 Tax=unclassified Moraxella TaxID=2685852 RepID=UPI003AF7C135